jgi:hypothetical protein
LFAGDNIKSIAFFRGSVTLRLANNAATTTFGATTARIRLSDGIKTYQSGDQVMPAHCKNWCGIELAPTADDAPEQIYLPRNEIALLRK